MQTQPKKTRREYFQQNVGKTFGDLNKETASCCFILTASREIGPQVHFLLDKQDHTKEIKAYHLVLLLTEA